MEVVFFIMKKVRGHRASAQHPHNTSHRLALREVSTVGVAAPIRGRVRGVHGPIVVGIGCRFVPVVGRAAIHAIIQDDVSPGLVVDLSLVPGTCIGRRIGRARNAARADLARQPPCIGDESGAVGTPTAARGAGVGGIGIASLVAIRGI